MCFAKEFCKAFSLKYLRYGFGSNGNTFLFVSYIDNNKYYYLVAERKDKERQGNYLLIASIFAARIKSLSVRPLILWV